MREVLNLDWTPADEDRETFYRETAAQAGLAYEDVLKDARHKFGFKDLAEPMTQKEIGHALVDAWGVRPTQSCSTCHR
jgi:hypothetical protein